MNDFQKAINDLQCVKKLAKLPKYGVTAIETAISAIQELEQYREIGTLEEFRGAMKRQQALPPRKALLFEGKQAETAKSNGIKNFDTYRCPECAREHEQLAVWLEDLKKYRQIGTVNECYGYKIHSQGIRTLNDCNNCGRKRNCTIKPRYGEYCRINCYLWEEDQNEPKS